MIQKSIPSLFTIGNLMLGMFGIMMAFDGKISMAAIMVIIAMLLDGLDGRVARALKCESEFGKELDSLSDVVSFGVAIYRYFVRLKPAGFELCIRLDSNCDFSGVWCFALSPF